MSKLHFFNTGLRYNNSAHYIYIKLYLSTLHYLTNKLHLRNREHVPSFYQVVETRVKVWENEKFCQRLYLIWVIF